jgi:hypothetical protein
MRLRRPICVNFSGLPLCKAGVWGGDAIPQKYPFFFFFRGFAAKKEEKTGLGLPPQSHETVTLTPMLWRPRNIWLQARFVVGCVQQVPPTEGDPH